jgi:hypothetical protein
MAPPFVVTDLNTSRHCVVLFCGRASNQPPPMSLNLNCWLLLPVQSHCSISAPDAVLLPVTSMHLPDCTFFST